MIYTMSNDFKMKKTIFLLSFLVPVVSAGYQHRQCGQRNLVNHDVSGRIVGGHPAETGEFPWQVSLQYYDVMGPSHFCGGAIIHPSWVVTAGHCVEDFLPSLLLVVVGKNILSKKEENEKYANVSRIIHHELYDRITATNDIALLQLEQPLPMSHFINVICLPEESQSTDGLVTVVGWGAKSEGGPVSDVLQEVDITVTSYDRCQQEYRPAKIYDSVICAGLEDGGKDSCQGDSGGPMLALDNNTDSYYLAGIVSWGFGCAHPHYSGVYTKVSYYRDWIRIHTSL